MLNVFELDQVVVGLVGPDLVEEAVVVPKMNNTFKRFNIKLFEQKSV